MFCNSQLYLDHLHNRHCHLFFTFIFITFNLFPVYFILFPLLSFSISISFSKLFPCPYSVPALILFFFSFLYSHFNNFLIILVNSSSSYFLLHVGHRCINAFQQSMNIRISSFSLFLLPSALPPCAVILPFVPKSSLPCSSSNSISRLSPYKSHTLSLILLQSRAPALFLLSKTTTALFLSWL